MRFKLGLIFILLGNTNIFSQSISLDWAKRAGGEGSDMVNDLSTDQEGNIYIVGTIDFTQHNGGFSDFFDAYFDTLTVIPSGSGGSAYLAKFDPLGNVLWVETPHNTVYSTARDITIDRFGNTYVIGTFYGTLSFGNISITSLKYEDIFIAKYNSEGDILWVKHGAVDTSSGHGFEIALDSENNIYAAGIFRSETMIFDGQAISGSGSQEVYFLKLNHLTGNLLWSKVLASSTVHGNSNSNVYDVDIDRYDNVYLSGSFCCDELEFGNQLSYQNNVTSASMFLAKFDKVGNLLWATFGRANNSLSRSLGGEIKVFEDGLYAIGSAKGSVTFDTLTLTSVHSEPVLFKYNKDGKIEWAKQPGLGITLSDLGLDASEDLYVAGNFQGNKSFDEIQVQSRGLDDVFLAKFNPNGDAIWVLPYGDRDRDLGKQISFDKSGSIILSGVFECSTSLDGFELKTHGDFSCAYDKMDVFLTKIQAIRVDFEPTSACREEQTSFSDKSYPVLTTSNIVEWQWSIDDVILYGNNPKYTFDEEGEYNVTLTVTNSEGLKFAVTKEVTVTAPTVPSVSQVGDNLVSTEGDTFQWYFNNEAITGATHQTFSIEGVPSGNYQVSVSTNGCEAISEPFNLVVTSVENSDIAESLDIHPNPASSALHLSISDQEGEALSYFLFDYTGKLVTSVQGIKIDRSGVEPIKVSAFPPGLYVLRLLIDNKQATFKLIIDH